MQTASIAFFLATNLIDLYLSLFTTTPQMVIALIFLASFAPYLWHLKRNRKQGGEP